LSDNLDTELFDGNSESLYPDLQQYIRTAEAGARVVVTDERGVVVMTSDRQDIGASYRNRPEVQQALIGFPVTGNRLSVTLNDKLFYAAVPIEHNYKIIGALRISFPGSAVTEIVSNRIRGLVFVGALTVLITLVATLFIANAITFRLRRIQDATAEIASGNLDVRLQDATSRNTSPEIRQLEQAFDYMVERLQTVLESQKTFASDASHQLRTPLTALRLKLENAALQVSNPEKSAQAIEAANLEVIRLQTLVDGLLTLARLEGSNPNLIEIAIADVLHEKQRMWQALAAEREISIEVDAEKGLKILASELAADQIIDAYLDNAIEHSPTGSTISLQARRVDDAVSVSIIDCGPGLTETERSGAFARFWRASADTNGTGLGLAIVRRLADTVGASVALHASQPDGTGIRAEVVFATPENLT
jgi:signal transduction histidine kinase